MSKLAAGHALLDHAQHHQLVDDLYAVAFQDGQLCAQIRLAHGESAIYRLIVWARSLRIEQVQVSNLARRYGGHWVQLHGTVRGFHGQPHPITVAMMVRGAEHEALTAAAVGDTTLALDVLAQYSRAPQGVGA